jgi:hypothetical protein
MPSLLERAQRPGAVGQRPGPGEVPQLGEPHREGVVAGDEHDLVVGQERAELVRGRETAEATAEHHDTTHDRPPRPGDGARTRQPTGEDPSDGRGTAVCGTPTMPGHAGRPGSVGSRGAASRRRSSGEGLRARPVTFRAERHRPSPRSGGPASGTTIPRSHRPLRRRCGPPTRHSGRCSRFGTRPRGPAPTTGSVPTSVASDRGVPQSVPDRQGARYGRVGALSRAPTQHTTKSQVVHGLSPGCPRERARPRPPGRPAHGRRAERSPASGLWTRRWTRRGDRAALGTDGPVLWTRTGRDRWRRPVEPRPGDTLVRAADRRALSSGGRGRRPRATTRRAGRSGSSSSSGPRS